MNLHYSKLHEHQFKYSLKDLLIMEDNVDESLIFKEYIANVDVNIQYEQNVWQRVKAICADSSNGIIIKDLQKIIFDYIYPNALPGEEKGCCFKLNLKSLSGLGICVSDKVLYYSEWEVCTGVLLSVSSNKEQFIVEYGHKGWKGTLPNISGWAIIAYYATNFRELLGMDLIEEDDDDNNDYEAL